MSKKSKRKPNASRCNLTKNKGHIMKKYFALLLSFITLQAYAMVDYSTLSQEEALAQYYKALEKRDTNIIRELLKNPYFSPLRNNIETIIGYKALLPRYYLEKGTELKLNKPDYQKKTFEQKTNPPTQQ